MLHPSTTPLRAFAGFLLFASFACKKLPNELPCGCDPNPPVYKKGNTSTPLAICGTFNFPIDPIQNPWDLISVYLGLQKQLGMYSIQELGTGITLNFLGGPSLDIKAIGYNFVINANITDLKGNPLIQVMDNKWYIYKNNVGKYNYDAKGMEIYDKLGHIAFSIDARPNAKAAFSTLVYQGISLFSDNTVDYFVYDDRLIPEFPYVTPEDKAAFEQFYNAFPIQPMFRYTGPNWQHARLN